MRSRSVIQSIVVALCACGMMAERPAQAKYGDILVMSVGDPNAPVPPPQAEPVNVWVPAENVVATWESVTAMSKLYNPGAPNAGTVPERSLSLSARVDVVDVNGLLGFDSAARGTLVLDEGPRVVYSKAVLSRYCHFYWPLRYTKRMSGGQWVSELQPYKLTVDMPIDPNRPYPLLLGRVEWSMYALINTQAETVDVPFSPSVDWVTLTPDLEIKVEQATAENGRYQYRLAMRYSRSKVRWEVHGAAISLWTHEPTPEVIVTKLDILDAQGRSVNDPTAGAISGDGSGAGDSGDLTAAAASDDLTTGTASGMGSCSHCGPATTFRFTLALNPSQQELRFILQNVPVPSL